MTETPELRIQIRKPTARNQQFAKHQIAGQYERRDARLLLLMLALLSHVGAQVSQSLAELLAGARMKLGGYIAKLVLSYDTNYGGL